MRFLLLKLEVLLGGSWVVVSRVRTKITIVITYTRGLITPLITTHEPPRRGPDKLGRFLV